MSRKLQAFSCLECTFHLPIWPMRLASHVACGMCKWLHQSLQRAMRTADKSKMMTMPKMKYVLQMEGLKTSWDVGQPLIYLQNYMFYNAGLASEGPAGTTACHNSHRWQLWPVPDFEPTLQFKFRETRKVINENENMVF